MLPMYLSQQCFGLADEALEDAIYDSQTMRQFLGIDLSHQTVPDAMNCWKFRHLLKQHQLTAAPFDGINADLVERDLLLRQGTLVEATIIAAPPSTKNAGKAREPEMHRTAREEEQGSA